MTYKAKGNNSHLDTIRADIAEMLNLQARKTLFENALMRNDMSKKKLESLQKRHTTISLRLNELLDKYNIS